MSTRLIPREKEFFDSYLPAPKSQFRTWSLTAFSRSSLIRSRLALAMSSRVCPIRIFQVDFSAGCGEVLEIITQYFYTA